MLALCGYQFVFEAAVPLVPVILANILFVLSIFSRSQAQRVAVIGIALAIIIPLGAFRSYSKGETSLMVAVLNVPVFLAVAYVCAQTLLAVARRRNVITKPPE